MHIARPLAALSAAALAMACLVGATASGANAATSDSGDGVLAGPPASAEQRDDLQRRLSGPSTGPRQSRVRLVARTTSRDAARAVRRAADALGLTTDTTELERFGFVAVEATPERADAVQARLASLTGVVSVRTSTRYEPMWTPNDPKYASQQSGMFKALAAPAAWDTSRGAGSVIAILDGGFQANHPDLVGKVAGTWDVVARNTDVSEAHGSLAPGHGTAVASVAAAASNNLKGIAGAAPSAKLLLVGVGDSLGDIYDDTSAAGIVWATDHGADVISMSYGAEVDGLSRAEALAVEYALSKDVVLVASGGNTPSGNPNYPAAADGVIGVGATNTLGTAQTSWSAYGPWIDLGAPGVGVPVAVPLAVDIYDGLKDGYTKLDGTSFSAPLVAGEAALLRSAHPLAPGTAIVSAITGHTKPITKAANLGFAHGVAQFAPALASMVADPQISSATATTPGVIDVSASSGYPSLSLRAAGSNAQTSPGEGKLWSWGLSGAVTVTAAACDASTCSHVGATRTVNVSNPAPVIAEPVDGSTAGLSVPLTLQSAAEGPAYVRWFADGTTVLGTDWATSTIVADTSALSNGIHQITAVWCTWTATTCDMAHPSAPVTVTVDRLRPTLTLQGNGHISPQAPDGRQDVAKVAFTTGGADTAVIGVKDLFGWVRGPITITPELAQAWTWDGKNNAGDYVADTEPLANAAYRIVIEASAESSTPAPHTVPGLASVPVVVDNQAPTVGASVSTPKVFYPYADGYLDKASIATSLSEAGASWTMKIKNSAGTTVRTLTGGAVGRRFVTTWSGRTASGAAVPAGTYKIELQVQDLAGMRTLRTGGTVTVSWKKLVYRTSSRTLSADLAAQTFYYDGRCTAVFGNARPGVWPSSSLQFVSRRSTAACPKGPPYYAFTENRFTLPTAVRYSTFSISTYGGGSIQGTGHIDDVGELDYLMRDDNTIGQVVTLTAPTKEHAGPTVRAPEYLVNGNQVRWLAGTSKGNWYDVRGYTIRWSYYTLA